MLLNGFDGLDQVVALTILLKLGNVGEVNHDLRRLFGWLDGCWLKLKGSHTKGLLLIIALMLDGDFLFLLHLLQKLGKQWPIQCLPFLGVLALVFTPLFQNQIPFFFRTTMYLSIVVGETF